MPAAAYPAHEAFRLATLNDYGILDTLNEPQFDRITRLAALVMDAPISAISLVDHSRQWFKSVNGLHLRETSRDASFCAHGLDRGEPLLVSDARQDSRFADNPLVIEGTIRSYFGAPLIAPNGMCLGMLCTAAPDVRSAPTEAQLKGLTDLSALAMREMLLHRASSALQASSEVADQTVRSKRILERLERALAARSELIASFSHELRTPLHGILGFNELAQDGLNADHNLQEYHGEIGLAAKRMQQAIEGMLASSARPQTWIKHQAIKVDVAILADETARLLWSLAFKHRVTISSLVSKRCEVLVDREALRQTLVQLGINAIQACSPNGGVTLTADIAPNGRVEACVFNPGVALTDLECVQAMTPLGQPCVAGGEGIGISLPVVKALIERSDGTVTLCGKASPAGTAALITLVGTSLECSVD